jgi:hypothetical protein
MQNIERTSNKLEKTNSKKTFPKSIKKIMKIKKDGNVTNKHQKRNPKPEKRFRQPKPQVFDRAVYLTKENYFKI